MKKKNSNTVLSFHVEQGAACLLALFSVRGSFSVSALNGGVRLTLLERIGQPSAFSAKRFGRENVANDERHSAACCDLLFSRRPTVIRS